MEEVDGLESNNGQTLQQDNKELFNMLTAAGWPEDTINQYIQHSVEQQQSTLSLLKLEGITKSYQQTILLDHVTLTIKPGEILGILGINGAGKSTLLNILVGFVQPDAGDIFLTLKDKKPVSFLKETGLLKKLTGFSPQQPSFHGKLTVLENLFHFAALHGLRDIELTERCNNILEFLDLNNVKDTSAQDLPPALTKRLDIGCALIHNPALLILDEPATDLDPIAAESFWKLLQKINHEGTTIVIASHVFDDLERVCTRIAFLRDKKIIETGTPEELRAMSSNYFDIVLQTTKNNYSLILKKLKVTGIIKTDIRTNQLVITTNNPEQVVAKLPAIIRSCKDSLLQLHMSKPSLRTIFESTIKKQT